MYVCMYSCFYIHVNLDIYISTSISRHLDLFVLAYLLMLSCVCKERDLWDDEASTVRGIPSTPAELPESSPCSTQDRSRSARALCPKPADASWAAARTSKAGQSGAQLRPWPFLAYKTCRLPSSAYAIFCEVLVTRRKRHLLHSHHRAWA